MDEVVSLSTPQKAFSKTGSNPEGIFDFKDILKIEYYTHKRFSLPVHYLVLFIVTEQLKNVNIVLYVVFVL